MKTIFFILLAVFLISMLPLNSGCNARKQSEPVISTSSIRKDIKNSPFTSTATVRVSRVIDGDTFETNSGEKVRLIGIDTPEKDQPFYTDAKEKLSELITGMEVVLEFDVQKNDKYGRTLAYAYTPLGENEFLFVNNYMLESGMATLYTVPPNVRHVDDFTVTQKESRNRKSGIWSAAVVSVEEYYVGSGNSGVFHRPGCPFAGKISPGNLVRYNSRDDALDKNKSPCRTCRP